MISEKLEYQPKGAMCRYCKHIDRNCSHLVFKDMPKISKGNYDGIVIVRCTDWENLSNEKEE